MPQSFAQTKLKKPEVSVVSHRALTPTKPLTKAQMDALAAAPKGFLDSKWPVPPKQTVSAGSTIKAMDIAVPTMSVGRKAHSAGARSAPTVSPISFEPYRSLPMPDPAPGNWKIRTHYDQGAFQLGVINYPYTPADRAAKDDLEGVIHRALDHPVIPLTSWNGCSAPHNTVTGRATSSSFGLDLDAWYRSETKRSFNVEDPNEWFEIKSSMPTVGVRSEQKIGTGI